MSPIVASRTTNSVSRDERIPFHTEMLYRPADEVGWFVGETENISRSGVLFRAPNSLEPNTPVVLKFSMPAEIGVDRGDVVVWSGEIVRTVHPHTADALPFLAARFFEYKMVRAEN